MENTWKPRQEAIRILQAAAYRAASERPVNSAAIISLHNAVYYLLTQRLPGDGARWTFGAAGYAVIGNGLYARTRRTA